MKSLIEDDENKQSQVKSRNIILNQVQKTKEKRLPNTIFFLKIAHVYFQLFSNQSVCLFFVLHDNHFFWLVAYCCVNAQLIFVCPSYQLKYAIVHRTILVQSNMWYFSNKIQFLSFIQIKSVFGSVLYELQNDKNLEKFSCYNQLFPKINYYVPI